MTPLEHQKPRPETAIANALWARRALDLYPVARTDRASAQTGERETTTQADDRS